MNTKAIIQHEPLNSQGELVSFPSKKEISKMKLEGTPPLVAANVDLRDFQYMPLDVVRFRDSGFSALIDGEAFRAGVLLWCAAWHQVPAGSLPNDDRILANLAGYGRNVTEWQKVKEQSLYGWIVCTDDRLYHPVVCEKVNESWQSKQQHNYIRFVDRLRKANKKAEVELKKTTEIPSIDLWISEGCPKDWKWKSESEYMEFRKNSNGIPKEFRKNSNGIPQNSELKVIEDKVRECNVIEDNTYINKQSISLEQKVFGDFKGWKPDLETLKTKLRLTKYSQNVDDILLMDNFLFHLDRFNTHHEKNAVLSDNQKIGKFGPWILSEYEKTLREYKGSKASDVKKTSRSVNEPWGEAENYTPVKADKVDTGDLV